MNRKAFSKIKVWHTSVRHGAAVLKEPAGR